MGCAKLNYLAQLSGVSGSETSAATVGTDGFASPSVPHACMRRRHLNLKSFGIHGKRTNSMAKLKRSVVRRLSGSLKTMCDCVGSRRIIYGVCETAHLPSSNVNVRRSEDFKCHRNNSHKNRKVE